MFKSLFDPDSAFGRAMETVLQLVVLNVLWLVCSLPIVTIGASSAALYGVLFKKVEDKDARVARQFFTAFRQNWKRATGTWLILLAVILVCLFDFRFAKLMDSFLWKVVAMIGLQVVGMICTFLFPLLARYENTWRNQLRNALLLGVANLPRMALVWVMWGAVIAVTIYSFETLYAMLLIWLLLGYSLLSFFTLRILLPVFNRLEENEQQEEANKE
ncbi:MAG: YesL family protein [Oscillospiraceae bacterium]|nr:YesL family protein [Oscillospiraceae bacterium]